MSWAEPTLSDQLYDAFDQGNFAPGPVIQAAMELLMAEPFWIEMVKEGGAVDIAKIKLRLLETAKEAPSKAKDSTTAQVCLAALHIALRKIHREQRQ